MAKDWLRRSDLQGFADLTGRSGFVSKVWTCLTEFAPSLSAVRMDIRTAGLETEIALQSLVDLDVARNVQASLYREMREPGFWLFKEWVTELRDS